MANEAIVIQPKEEGYGQIVISDRVIHHIVMITVNEARHIFFEDGTGKRSISIRNKNNVMNIEIKVRVQYGQNVDKECQKLQSNLQRNLELMIDYKHPVINISVVGFKFN